MSEGNLQKDYIQKVVDISVNPLQCSNNYFNNKTHKFNPGKRYNIGRYAISDYLSVGSNQIVFELDSKTYSTNYDFAKKIMRVLDEREIQYHIFASGGKGIHIEVWFSKPEFTKETKELFIKAMSYNLSFKHIRLWLWNMLLDEANIRHEVRGVGKPLDTACMLFDDLRRKTRLLRVCGGRKFYVDKETLKEQVYYKTVILKEDFNKSRVKIQSFDKVRYPQSLKPYILNNAEFSEFLAKFIKEAESREKIPFKKIDLSKNKGYFGLDGVQRVFEGLPKGKRSSGAQILAIAMANDGMSEKEQEKIMTKYVDNCSQVGEDFVLDEAMAWVRWASSQPNIFWNCNLLEELDLHDASVCKFCKHLHKDANKLLTQSTILDQIKELLDIEIKGEHDTKMLIFLLMLSKDFPSKTGMPGWNIQGDPMSQNIILSSDSSSGKSWITKKILELFGEKNKDYYIVSRCTKSVLNYYTEQNMDGKVMFIEELQGLDEATAQLRVWMSEGELNLETVEKLRDAEGNEVNTKVSKSTMGQPVFISNQAEGEIGEQLNNRSWILSTDTSGIQTGHILDYQDEVNQGKLTNSIKKKRLIQDALKQLKPYHFLIPFSDSKILNIPTNVIRSRRDYNKFMTLIKCSAYLHQKQRCIMKKDEKEFLVCDLRDYDIAKKYSDSILGATFSGLTIQQIDTINTIRQSGWAEEFEISDLMRSMHKTQPYWYGQLKQLCDLGFIVANRQGAGKPTLYSLNQEKAVNLINMPPKSALLGVYLEGINRLKKANFEPITQIMTENQILGRVDRNLNPEFIGQAQNPIENGENNLFSKYKYPLIGNSPRSECVSMPDPLLIIGSKFKSFKQIFKQIIAEKKDKIVKFDELQEKLKIDDNKLLKILNQLKKEGEILEVKPDKYQLL